MEPARNIFLLLLLVTATGCAELGYYTQAVGGQMDVLSRREPIDALLQEENLDAATRQRLALVLRMRDFATRSLKLPENGSFRSYADLDRPYVVWNVFAAPEFSVDLRQWCYPVIGCAAYRGYFSETQANQFANELSRDGFDVYVAGIPAYSTLGWFADPLLNTVIGWPEERLAGLIFHELAHQQLYLAGDSTFNESFAVAVEVIGVERWLTARNKIEALERYRNFQGRREQFTALVLSTRAELESLYGGGGEPERLLEGKTIILQEMRLDYARLKEIWGGFSGYDHWFGIDLNNAQLASIATYQTYVPGFLALFADANGEFAAFYAAIEEISKLPAPEREARLKSVAVQASPSALPGADTPGNAGDIPAGPGIAAPPL